MANDERMIFPVGFDLDSGLEQVEKDWAKIQRRLQKTIDEKPLTIKMSAGMWDEKEGKGFETFFKNARTSIDKIRESLDKLSVEWNKMSEMEKFDSRGDLTDKAREMIQQYNELTAALETYGRTLSQVVAMEKKSVEQELKANRAALESQLKSNAQKAAATAKNRADYEKYVNQLRQQQNAETMLTQKGLAAEKQRADLRRQAKQASDEEYQSLVRQLRMEEQLAASEANRARQQKYNATRKQGLERLKILNAEEKSIAAITAKLQVQQQRLQSANLGSAKFKKIADEVQRLSKLLDEANAKIRGVDEAERRRASGINATTAAYGRQMGYVERLITKLGVYTGIYAAAGMLRDIRETTAEFELQEVALGAIIQDAHEAQVLFSQIKAAAVESPYQIKELVNYTKQLAAYGFEQNELFDTTMKLADISAGLGADMSRIILAVGQVSAATVLKGTELRQFTELGIPMVELLAEKFTQLRGEVVTTGEVFEMISDKAVSFKMVEEILNDLTSAGGIFYDMQRKQAETLAGQWSNLKDTVSIAYAEIGNTAVVDSAMRGFINGAKGLIDRWEGLANVLGLVASAAITYKVANSQMLSGHAKTRKAILDRIKAEKVAEAQSIKALAIGRQLTTEESRRLALTKKLRAADYQAMIAESQMTSNQLVRYAIQNRNNKQIMIAIRNTGKLTAEQIKNIQSMNVWTATMTRMKLGLQSFGASVKALGASMLSFLPIAAIAAVSSIIEQLISKSRNQSAAVEKVNESYQKQELELYRIENAYNDLNKAIQIANGNDTEFAKTTYGKKIEQLQKIDKMLERFGLGAAIDFSVLNDQNIDAVFNTWMKQLKDVNALSKDWGSQLALTAEAFEGTIMGWSIAGENLNSDMKDLTRSYNKLISNKTFRKDLERMREYVNEMANGYDEIYQKLTDVTGEDAKLAIGQKRRSESEYEYQMRIMRNYEKIRKIAEGSADSATEFAKRFGDGSMAFFEELDLSKFEADLAEVMHEFEKTTGFFEGQDPVTIRMAIDDQWAIREWGDWQKDAFIAELNKERLELGLELIPTLSSDSVKEVQKGWKSILATEFPTFFDKEELSNMSKLSDVVSRIEDKMKGAADAVAEAEKLTNNLTSDSKTYERVVGSIEEQWKSANEEKAKGEEMDKEAIHTAFAQMDAIVGQNELLDSQIQKRKEMAKAEFDLAKAVKDRLIAENLSMFAKDFKFDFPDLMVDEFRKMTDADYNTDFLVSDDDLAKMGSVLDIYSMWEKNVKAIADAREKMYGVGLSEEKIAEEQARIDAERARINEELAEVNRQIMDNDFKAIVAKRNALSAELSQTTNAKERQRIEQEILDLETNQNTAEAAKLAVKKQVLEASLNETNNAEAINRSIEEYVSWLNQAESLWEKIRQKFNFNPLSGIAQDIADTFPDLLAENVKGDKGVTVPIEFYLSEKDLQSIWNGVDAAEVFERKIQAIEKELEDINKVRLDPAISEEAREDAEIYALALEQVYQNLLNAQGRYVQQYSDIAKDVQERFPQLMKDIFKGLDRETYSTKGLFTKNELRGIEDVVDLYSLWSQKLQGVTTEIENYNKKLDENITAELREQILATIKSLTDEKTALEAMGKAYGFLLKQKGGASGAYNDDWLILWKNRMSFMKDFQKGVEDLSKKMQEADALAAEQDIMRYRGKSVKINVEDLTGSSEELIKWYDDAIEEVMKKIKAKGGKPFEGLGVQAILAKDTKSRMIKAYQELLQELFNAKTDFETKQLEDDLKKEIDRLATAVSRSKEAKDFYDKMLGMTGDRQLSADLTMSVYGGVGDDLKENIKAQLENAFEGVNIKPAFDGDKIDWSQLNDLVESIPIESKRKEARKLVNEGIKDNARWLLDLYKTYEKFQTYEERRTAVMKREEETRKRIRENASLKPEEKEKQLAASHKREATEIDTIDLEEFKASEDWIQTFENIDKVGTKSIQHLMVVLKEFIETNKDLTPEQIKTLMSEYDKLYEGLIARNPLKAITDGTKEYFAALREVRNARNDKRDANQEVKEAQSDIAIAKSDLASADNDYERAVAAQALFKAEERLAKALKNREKAETGLRKAQDKSRTGLNKLHKGVNEAGAAYSALGDVVSGIQETFNVDETSELGIALTSVSQALTMVAGVLGIINAMITLIESHPLVLAISAGIMAIIGAIMLFKNLKTADAEAKIEQMSKKLEELEYAYERLEKAQEKAFGSDYITNYNQRMENLLARQEAYLAQADAERSKGKEADEQKAKDYEKSAREAADSIADAQYELSEHFLGTDLTSAARDFAQAWIDAYKEFGSTTDAIKEKFSEMVENMVVESLAAKIIQGHMQDIFDTVESLSKDGQISVSDAAHIAELSKLATENIDVGMTNLMNALEAAGISVRGMGSDLTGISKDIATASEESILGLAAGINTQNFYISQVPPKLDTIIAILQGGASPVGGINVQDLITIQNQHLAHLPNIATNTLNTADRCERAALACESALSKISSVISIRGTASTHVVNTN